MCDGCAMDARCVCQYHALLVSGRYVLVNIILDMSLAYGLTTRPRANTIIDTVTYLVDGTYRRWFWEVF